MTAEQGQQLINQLANIQTMFTFIIAVGVTIAVYKFFRMFF